MLNARNQTILNDIMAKQYHLPEVEFMGCMWPNPFHIDDYIENVFTLADHIDDIGGNN